MCDKVVSKEPFMLKYYRDMYKTQENCDKVVDAYLPALKWFTDWFVVNKKLKNLMVLYSLIMI